MTKKKTGPKKTKEEEKIHELTEDLQRLQAEFENYKKRVDKEKAEFCTYAKADILQKLLPLVDDFQMALKNKDGSKNFVKGIEMIYAELMSLLQKEGVKKIEALGKKLDPNVHDVLLTEKSDKEEGTILEELQPGYMLNEKVLRHSKVKVSKK